MSHNPNLPYSRYPVRPELRCNSCGDNNSGPIVPENCQKPGIAYKNGRPYDCNCDKIFAPYSMPYDAHQCKQCQPPYQAVCNSNPKSRCQCHTRATISNNNMYEAFDFPGKWY